MTPTAVTTRVPTCRSTWTGTSACPSRPPSSPTRRTTTLILEDDDGNAIGYTLLGEDPVPECVTGPAPLQIRRFYIDQAWKGTGVAQQLMAAVDVEARRRGRKTIWLLAWFRNFRAHAFYRKCGFEQVGIAPYLFGNTMEQDVAMARPTAP